MISESDVDFQRAIREGDWHYAFSKLFVVGPDGVLYEIATCRTARPDQDEAIRSLVNLRNCNRPNANACESAMEHRK